MNDVRFDANAWCRDALSSDEMAEVLSELAQKITAGASVLTPVRTGHLKASWWWTQPVKHLNPYARNQETWAAVIGDTAFYASYVEFGTRYMDARAMLQKAVEANNVIWPEEQKPVVPPREPRANSRNRARRR